MTATTERIFVIGGTGNVGTKAVNDLVLKDIPVTLYTRSPTKVAKLFSNNQHVNVIQGDFSDLTPLKEGMKGHTRLFLLYSSFEDFVEKKEAIAKLAYASGIKQIVDISSFSASDSWRTSFIGTAHVNAEKAILEIPQRGSFVTLRPGRFMSNLLTFERASPEGFMFDTSNEDEPQGWISPNDIGAIAAVVLSEDIKKHADSVYELIGDIVTPAERVSIASRVLERSIHYQKVSPSIKYDNLMKFGTFSHFAAYGLAATIPSMVPTTTISTGIFILLGREPETLEQYILLNKANLL